MTDRTAHSRELFGPPALPARRGWCSGSNTSMGGNMGGARWNNLSTCPVCGKRVRMRPGRAGRLYTHKPPKE